MKKIILCAAVVAAAAFGVIKATEVNNSEMSDLQVENLELLAVGEPTTRAKYVEPASDPSVDCCCMGSGDEPCCH